MGTPIVKIIYGRYRGDFFHNITESKGKYVCYVYLISSGSTVYNTEIYCNDEIQIVDSFFEYMQDLVGLMEVKIEYPRPSWMNS